MTSRHSRNEGQRAGRILCVIVNSYRGRDQGHAEEKVITSIHGTTEGNTSSQKYTSLQHINVYTSDFKFKTTKLEKRIDTRHKSAAIFPKILMHLMMAELVETCCATDVPNKDIQL